MGEEMTPVEVALRKRKAREAAERSVLDAHPDEVRLAMIREHDQRGVEYKPRLTGKEKAIADIQRIARENGIGVSLDTDPYEQAANTHAPRMIGGDKGDVLAD